MAAMPEARTNCAERGEYVVRGAYIEIAGRLVGQQDPRRIGDRTRDGDALLLAARQFRRPMHQAFLKSQIAQQFGGAGACFARGRPRIICGRMTFSSAENSGSR